MNRRDFLKTALTGMGTLAASPYVKLFEPALAVNKISVSRAHFPQSVVCADVDTTSAFLWTRVVSNADKTPLEIPLVYEVAEDSGFKKKIAQNIVPAQKESDFTVKVPLTGLSENKKYYYRFLHENNASPSGQFKTLAMNPERVRFAFVSCNDYINGFYSAYHHLAQEDVEFVVHLGDYIYETTGSKTFQADGKRVIQLNEHGFAYTLEDYRNLYKTYRSDPNFQKVHEKLPFYMIWDDHEFSNDCCGAYAFDNGEKIAGGDLQEERRRNASRAYWEFIPGKFEFDPKESDYRKQIRLYRNFQCGKLFQLNMTDERLYRDTHPCGENTVGQRYVASCPKPKETSMLGKEQLDWFLSQMHKAQEEGVTWKIHANEVAMSQMKLSAPTSKRKVYLNMDQWDGYAVERKNILSYLRQKDIKNYLVITGDLHTFVAGGLYEDFSKPENPVGTEFLVTSITSANLGQILKVSDEKALLKIEEGLVSINPNLKYFNSHHHGYAIVELTPEEAIVEYWKVSSIEDPDVKKTTKQLVKKFKVKHGTQMLQDIT